MNNFEKALGLTMKLHALFKEGRGDSDDADALRDQLDVYYGWCSPKCANTLSDVERRLLNTVSAALCRYDV
jgi:hypothetical protein